MRVYLAVGHGVKSTGAFDPGAAGGGWDEQTAGDIVVQSAAYLLRSWGVQVKDESYSRDPNFSGTDDLVRAWGADLLVSVHHDWIKAATGFFSLWYKENGRVLGKVIERNVARAGFPLRSYPNAGYRDDLSILKTVGSIPNTLIECGRIGQYTAQQLEKLGEAVAHGIAEYAGIDTQEEPDMTPDEVRAIVREEIDTVSASEAIDRAEQELIAAKVLSSPHPHSKAASVGFVMLTEARILAAMNQAGIDLSKYQIQLVPK